MQNSFAPQAYTQMGYSQADVRQAFKIAQNKKIDVFDALQLLQSSPVKQSKSQARLNQSYLTPLRNIKTRDFEIVFSKAGDRNNILLKDQVREAKLPVGLLNVSNCCYLNSLLQCYFLLSDFVKQLFVAQPLQNIRAISENKIKIKRLENQYKLLHILKKTFYQMAMSSRKFIDPQPILKNLVDSLGQKVSYGQEKDLFQINMQIIQRLNQCLYHTKKNYRNQSSQDNFNCIKKLFYGIKVEFSEDSEYPSDFLGIILNSKHENLTQAIDNQFNYEVQIEGKISKRHTYIRQAPQYMFFYISRMQFDRQGKQAIKNEDQLSFEFQIYLDRYLEKYKYSQAVKTPAIQKLLLEKSKVINQIKHIDLFSLKIEECRVHANFVDNLSQKLPSEQIVSAMKSTLTKRLEQLQMQLQKIESRKQKYFLIYIFVHRGDARSGHYWGYGKNGAQWIRFDVNCRRMSQQQMLKDMEKSQGTPYSLVYTKQSKLPNINYDHYLDKVGQIDPGSSNYIGLIPQVVQQEICMQNRQLIDSAIKRNEILSVQNTIKQYKSRFNTIKSIFQSSQKNDARIKLPIYGNFALYLYSKNERDLAKYNIFVLSLKSVSKINPNQLFTNPSFFKALQTSFRKKAKGDQKLKIYAIQNQAKQNERYNLLYANFVHQRKCLRLIGSINQMLNGQQYNNQSLRKLIEEVDQIIKSKNSYIDSILQQLYGLLVLKLSKLEPVKMKHLERFKESNPLLIYQVKEFKGITEQSGLLLQQQPEPEIDYKYKESLWNIQDTKKTNISSQLQQVLTSILECLQPQLTLYKNISKKGQIEKQQKCTLQKQTSQMQQKYNLASQAKIQSTNQETQIVSEQKDMSEYFIQDHSVQNINKKQQQPLI